MDRFIRDRRWAIGLITVITGVAIAALLWAPGPNFSDAPGASDLSLSESGGVLALNYATCRRVDNIPRLLVWEEADDGRLRWATFLRTGGPRNAFWLSRREDGITFPPGQGDGLPPVEGVRITVYVMPEDSERIEVAGLPLADLPDSDGSEVLLADGTTADRQSWMAERRKAC